MNFVKKHFLKDSHINGNVLRGTAEVGHLVIIIFAVHHLGPTTMGGSRTNELRGRANGLGYYYYY